MRFFYSAADKFGNIQKGIIEAKDQKEAAELLVQKALNPLSITIAAERRAGERRMRLPMFLTGGLSLFDQVMITRHLGTILNTGTDLLTALDIIAEDALKPIVRDMMVDLKSRVTTGETLSSALSHWKVYLNPVFLNLVKAGEVSGNLPEVLLRYSRELRKDYTFSRKVKGAMFYPALLIAALIGMMLLMLTIVVPKLKDLFSGTGVAIPWYTKLLFTASDFWLAWTLPLVIGGGVILALFIFALRDPRLKNVVANILWYIPYLNRIQRNATLLRVTKTLSSLIKAGFNLKAAVLITADSVGIKYKTVLSKIAQENLERGISLSDSLRMHKDLFPPILINLIATGEKSGQIDQILDQMADFYEEEVIYALEHFLTVLEPILIIIVGGIVGLMAGSLISPIYRFIGKF